MGRWLKEMCCLRDSEQYGWKNKQSAHVAVGERFPLWFSVNFVNENCDEKYLSKTLLLWQRQRWAKTRFLMIKTITKCVFRLSRRDETKMLVHEQATERQRCAQMLRRGSGGKFEWQKQLFYVISTQQLKSLCFNTVKTDTLGFSFIFLLCISASYLSNL